ncbi:hypothetical protein LTR78_009328 [Recurvomyces mirabilis]|uniref:Uncharacterized protein n=1 Tax=Recurvomyces mirabilis TaxID=574656 RepID=A0AAE0TTM3_9PEZI|nr:hypothetical protein LTR78_009328 [Recurvomyces mirabilis]KAK5150331.1 hypothetical protein LTS14_010170 [Recurvomyces mirabilis]
MSTARANTQIIAKSKNQYSKGLKTIDMRYKFTMCIQQSRVPQCITIKNIVKKIVQRTGLQRSERLKEIENATPPYNESEKSVSPATVCESRKQETAQQKKATKQVKIEREQQAAREKKAAKQVKVEREQQAARDKRAEKQVKVEWEQQAAREKSIEATQGREGMGRRSSWAKLLPCLG